MNSSRYDFCYQIPLWGEGPLARPQAEPGLSELCQIMHEARGSGSQEFLDEALEKRLGNYTYEQEADELALLMMISVGLEAEAAIEALFSLFEASGSGSQSEFTLNECRDLLKNQWRDLKTGNETFVPLGTYKDPHHAWCARIFNLDSWRGRFAGKSDF